MDAPPQKIIIVLIVVGVIVIGLIGFKGGFSDLFTSKESTGVSGSDAASGRNDQKPESEFVAEVDKDSVLVSEDGGKTFNPQFRIKTSGKVEQANVLSITFHPVKRGTVIVSSVADGIFKKTSGSTNWTPIVFPPKQIYGFILDRENPDNRMFASGVVDANGRVFRTDNGGDNWRAVYSEPGSNTKITSLAQHMKRANIILAGTSEGTVIKSEDGGDTWQNVGSVVGGMVRDISFDSTKASIYYLLSFRTKMYYSPDSGVTWLDWEEEKRKEVETMQRNAQKLSAAGDRKGAESLGKAAQALAVRNQENKMPRNIVSIRSDPNISGTIYAGTDAGLYRSTDYGKYWYEVNIIESAKKFAIRSIAINQKDSSEIVFVSGKSFHKSLNKGVTWAVTPLSNNRDASFVAFDPFDRSHVFVGVSSAW